MKIKLLSICFFALVLFCSGFASADCNSQYESCITSCCNQCGSYTTRNPDGDLVCYLGTSNNPDADCVDACMPCSTQYQNCVKNQGESDDDLASGNASCSCCGALLIPIVSAFGAVILRI